MPSDAADFTGRMATVTGWGRLKYGGGVPSILQEVQVNVMNRIIFNIVYKQRKFTTQRKMHDNLKCACCAMYCNVPANNCPLA